MTLTEPYIRKLYSRLKSFAHKAIRRGDFNSALKYLSMAAHTAYTFYLGFTDGEVEETIEEISHAVIRTKESYSGESGVRRVVFMDTFSQDTQGLTMQYVEAIIAAGWELLYLTSFNLSDPRSRCLRKVLTECPRVKVAQMPSGLKPLRKARWIYDTVMEFGPQDAFLHISPSAVEMACAAYSFPSAITRYQVNLTDHAYWVGAGCMDYSLEFRPYGAFLSVEHRGFAKDRVLMLPYYPVMKETPFEGFPPEADGKVKIFAGASYYKIVDQDDTFFKMNKAILDRHPEAVTLFAGGGDRTLLDSLIEKYGLRGRFIPIGQRNDIYQCFLHSDIYLSSYPLWGGLMSQYAANASLPILAYRGESKGLLEEVVCQKKTIQITLPSIDDVVAESDRLIEDEGYRRQRGSQIHSCVISQDEFSASFVHIIESHNSPIKYDENAPLSLHLMNIEAKLRLENSNGGYASTFLSVLGIKGIIINPSLCQNGLKARILSSRIGKIIMS